MGGATFPSATLSSLSVGTDLFGPFEELVLLPSTLVEGWTLAPRVRVIEADRLRIRRLSAGIGFVF